jgi:hypothetical protein
MNYRIEQVDLSLFRLSVTDGGSWRLVGDYGNEGAAAAWPIAGRAQQSERMRRIGVLMNLAADDPEAPGRVAAFAKSWRRG